MKRLSLVAAAVIIVCAAAALVLPAIAQQTPAQTNGDNTEKQRPATGPTVRPQHQALPGAIRPLSPQYTIRSADGQPLRATADSDANGKSKGGGEEIEPTFGTTPQKVWVANEYRLTPSGTDSSTTDSSTPP